MSEIIKKALEPLQQKTTLGVLKTTERKIFTLENEAENLLKLDKNNENLAKKLLRAKYGVLTDLPRKLNEISKNGVAVPDEARKWASEWSDISERILEKDTIFELPTILAWQGDKKGEPNELQKLIFRLERRKPNSTK